MNRTERYLYHQIHPIKPMTDVAASFASTWLLWERHWAAAVVIGFVPPALASTLVLWRADLERLRPTPLGRYVAGYMTRRIEAARVAGQVIMWVGAAARVPWLIPYGFVVIAFAWLGGLVNTGEAQSGR